MSRLAFLTARAWLDEDGKHVWAAHDCTNGRVTAMLPYPPWGVADDRRVEPSFHCHECDTHVFLEIGEGDDLAVVE